MKKFILSTVLLVTMSVFVQEGICDVKISARNSTIAGKKVLKKAPTLEQMSGIKKRFGTHKGLLEYFLNVLDNLTEGTDPLNTRTRQLIKQLEEILPILRKPANIDSDACKSLQTIRDYLVSITENLKGKKKIELAKKCVEALKPVDEYVEKLKEKEALEQEKTPPELPPRPQRLLDRNSSRISPSIEEMSPPSKKRRVDASLDTPIASVESSSATAEDKSKLEEKSGVPAPEVPADYAVAPPPSPVTKNPSEKTGSSVDGVVSPVPLKPQAASTPPKVKEKDKLPPRAQSAPPSLFDEIRARKQLKHVEQRKDKVPPEKTDSPQSLSAQVGATVTSRRLAMGYGDDDSDNEYEEEEVTSPEPKGSSIYSAPSSSGGGDSVGGLQGSSLEQLQGKKLKKTEGSVGGIVSPVPLKPRAQSAPPALQNLSEQLQARRAQLNKVKIPEGQKLSEKGGLQKALSAQIPVINDGDSDDDDSDWDD